MYLLLLPIIFKEDSEKGREKKKRRAVLFKKAIDNFRNFYLKANRGFQGLFEGLKENKETNRFLKKIFLLFSNYFVAE